MDQFSEPAFFGDVQGYCAILVSPLYEAGSGLLYSAIVPLQPKINLVWCSADLASVGPNTLAILKNPGATGLNPAVLSVISPIDKEFTAKAALLRDSIRANENMFKGDKYFQPDFLCELFEGKKVSMSTYEKNIF